MDVTYVQYLKVESMWRCAMWGYVYLLIVSRFSLVCTCSGDSLCHHFATLYILAWYQNVHRTFIAYLNVYILG